MRYTPSYHHTMNQPRARDLIKEQAEKRAKDIWGVPLDKANEQIREWCYYQALKDLEVYQELYSVESDIEL